MERICRVVYFTKLIKVVIFFCAKLYILIKFYICRVVYKKKIIKLFNVIWIISSFVCIEIFKNASSNIDIVQI